MGWARRSDGAVVAERRQILKLPIIWLEEDEESDAGMRMTVPALSQESWKEQMWFLHIAIWYSSVQLHFIHGSAIRHPRGVMEVFTVFPCFEVGDTLQTDIVFGNRGGPLWKLRLRVGDFKSHIYLYWKILRVYYINNIRHKYNVYIYIYILILWRDGYVHIYIYTCMYIHIHTYTVVLLFIHLDA